MTILVTGATGNQGGAVARQLLDRGHQVRALTRNPQAPAAVALADAGAEVVAGDLLDRASCEAASRGVDAVLAVGTPYEAGVETEVKQGLTMLAAAKAAGVQHLLYSSVASADRSTGIPHFDSKYEIEQQIIASGVPFTIVAPVYFMDNLLAPWMLSGLREGALAMALPADRVLQQIAVADLAGFMVSVLENRDRFLGERIDIAGDEVTGAQAAAAVAQSSGRQIEYVELPPEQRATMGEDLKRMLDWFDDTGYSVDIESLRSEHADVGWHTYQQWADAQDWDAALAEPTSA